MLGLFVFDSEGQLQCLMRGEDEVAEVAELFDRFDPDTVLFLVELEDDHAQAA